MRKLLNIELVARARENIPFKISNVQCRFSAYGEGNRGADAIGRHTHAAILGVHESVWCTYPTDLTYLPLTCYPRIALNLFPGQLLDEMRHEEVLIAAWIYQEVSLVSSGHSVFTP